MEDSYQRILEKGKYSRGSVFWGIGQCQLMACHIFLFFIVNGMLVNKRRYFFFFFFLKKKKKRLREGDKLV